MSRKMIRMNKLFEEVRKDPRFATFVAVLDGKELYKNLKCSKEELETFNNVYEQDFEQRKGRKIYNFRIDKLVLKRLGLEDPWKGKEFFNDKELEKHNSNLFFP